jgi:hypothetical protein
MGSDGKTAEDHKGPYFVVGVEKESRGQKECATGETLQQKNVQTALGVGRGMRLTGSKSLGQEHSRLLG